MLKEANPLDQYLGSLAERQKQAKLEITGSSERLKAFLQSDVSSIQTFDDLFPQAVTVGKDLITQTVFFGKTVLMNGIPMFRMRRLLPPDKREEDKKTAKRIEILVDEKEEVLKFTSQTVDEGKIIEPKQARENLELEIDIPISDIADFKDEGRRNPDFDNLYRARAIDRRDKPQLAVRCSPSLDQNKPDKQQEYIKYLKLVVKEVLTGSELPY